MYTHSPIYWGGRSLRPAGSQLEKSWKAVQSDLLPRAESLIGGHAVCAWIPPSDKELTALTTDLCIQFSTQWHWLTGLGTPECGVLTSQGERDGTKSPLMASSSCCSCYLGKEQTWFRFASTRLTFGCSGCCLDPCEAQPGLPSSPPPCALPVPGVWPLPDCAAALTSAASHSPGTNNFPRAAFLLMWAPRPRDPLSCPQRACPVPTPCLLHSGVWPVRLLSHGPQRCGGGSRRPQPALAAPQLPLGLPHRYLGLGQGGDGYGLGASRPAKGRRL